MKKDFKIPFIGKKQITDGRGYNEGSTYNEIDNKIFKATLTYDKIEHSASTSLITWYDTNSGYTYISTSELLHNILKGESQNVVFIDNLVFTIIGEFTFRKQGRSVFLTDNK